MISLNRRSFLSASGTAALLAAIGGCSSGNGAGGSRSMSWWDHFGPLQSLQQETFAKFAKQRGGIPVEYTFYNASKMGQALQLAKQGGQLPDVSSLAGLLIPVPALIKAGWIQPLDLNAAAKRRLNGALVDGVHIFDGKVYSFPIFSFRQYASANWFNTTLLKKSGLDPDNPPTTYDDFRTAARAVQKGGVYGWIWNVGMPPRLEAQVDDMAQAAGFQGAGGMLYRTGEYAYHADPYLKVLEFLTALNKDKLLVPGSSGFIDKVARARWVTGIAGFYFDGPWCAGAALQDSKDFADSLGVGPMLVPEKGMLVTAYRGLTGGSFWLSKSSRHVDAANLLLSDYFTTEDYYVGVASHMDQPPRDLAAVTKSPAHRAYKSLIKMFGDQVFLAPVPAVKNVAVNKVLAEMTEVTPSLGDIVQGTMTGDITDVRATLKKLSGKTSKQREQALATAKKQGAQVSLDDWAFPNWKPRSDYTNGMYAN